MPLDATPRPSKPTAEAVRPAPGLNDHPSVQRVRAALQGLIGKDGVTFTEGYGRLVITTADDLLVRGPGHFQLSSRALSVMAPSLQTQDTDQQAAVTRSLAAVGNTEESTILRQSSGAPAWMMVLRDIEQPGRWRAQAFDAMGFTGHTTHGDRAAALLAANEAGFTVADDTALDRVRDAPAFRRSLFAEDVAARIRAGSITTPHGTRLLAEYDARARVLHSVARAGAQAFVTADGEVMCLLAERIKEGEEQAVYLHEIMHRYGKRALGQVGQDHLIAHISGWSQSPAGSTEMAIFKAASRRARLASAGNEALFDEEIIAYAVEEAISQGVRPSAEAHPATAAGWLDQVAGTLRGILQTVSGDTTAPLPAPIDAQTIVDLSYAFAQLESPERVKRIMDVLTTREQQILTGWIERKGAPIWHSELERRVRTRGQSRMPAAQWAAWIDAQVKNGIKPDEIHWSGVNDWLRALPPTRPVLREEVLSFLQRNGVQVEEVVLQDRAIAVNALVATDVYTEGDQWTVVFNDGTTIGISQEIAEDESQAIEEARILLEEEGSGSTPESAARYSSYTLRGGQRYREVLLTLKGGQPIGSYAEWLGQRMGISATEAETAPEYEDDALHAQFMAEESQTKSSFHSKHWNEPNVLAHVRLTDRTDEDGNKVLFVEELQSDWASAGQAQGFKRRSKAQTTLPPNFVVRENAERGAKFPSQRFYLFDTETNLHVGWSGATPEEAIAKWMGANERKAAEVDASDSRIPAAPFVDKTDKWLALSLKRIMLMAVVGGYDRVAFITGEQSAERYRLDKQIESMEVTRLKDGEHYHVYAKKNTGEKAIDRAFPKSKLPDAIGKELANKAIEATSGAKDYVQYHGLDLKVGGEGMKTFYDKIVPAAVKDVLKRVGGGQMEGVSIGGTATYEQLVNAAKRTGKTQAELDAMPVATRKALVDAQLPKQPGFTITEAMRAAVAGGLPLFSQLPPSSPTLEYKLIKAQYKGTDQWMKAPNGARSKLTERQWVQVRTPSFKKWFGDWENDPENASKAVDANGEPKVFYHGSKKAGFSVFDTQGKGKTRGTGAFFSDSYSVAASYSGSRDDAPLYRAEQLLKDPELLDDLEVEEGILVQVRSPFGIMRWDWYANLESARDDLGLDAEDEIVSKPGYEARYGDYEECTGDRDEVLTFLADISAEKPGIYEAFINVREMPQIDWQDRSWDEGPEEVVWNVLDQDGHILDTLYDEAECRGYRKRHPGCTIRKATQQQYMSTDDAARQERDCASDGVLITGVWDSGPEGPPSPGNILIVFKPENIKSASVNCGSFDPQDQDIRMSVRHCDDGRSLRQTHHERQRLRVG